MADPPSFGERGDGKRNMRRAQIIKLLLVLILCVCVSGCAQWRKKFIRKRAKKKPAQIVSYEPKEYQPDPSDVLYRRYFVFWKAWQQELIGKLGDSRKSDLRFFTEALKNLHAMRNHLADSKAVELDVHIKRLDGYYRKYQARSMSTVQSKRMSSELNRLMLRIDKEFRYSRVKEFVQDYKPAEEVPSPVNDGG